jgi:hypothetical protein
MKKIKIHIALALLNVYEQLEKTENKILSWHGTMNLIALRKVAEQKETIMFKYANTEEFKTKFKESYEEFKNNISKSLFDKGQNEIDKAISNNSSAYYNQYLMSYLSQQQDFIDFTNQDVEISFYTEKTDVFKHQLDSKTAPLFRLIYDYSIE